MEWTNELISDFLKLYQNEPALWNMATPEHKNKNDAYEAWCRIKSNLRNGNISIKEMKKKRDNLMSTYRRQRAKVRESMKTACGDDDIYKPEWPFYDFMASFLDDMYNAKKVKRSEDSLDAEEFDEDENLNNTQATSDQMFEVPIIIEKNKSNRGKLNVSKKADLDPCLLYCELLYSKLKGFQESTRDIAMLEIDKLMFNLKQHDSQIKTMEYQNTVPTIGQQVHTYYIPTVLPYTRQPQSPQ